MRARIVIAALGALLLLSGCAGRQTGLARPIAPPELPETLAKKATRLPPLSDPTLKGLSVDGADVDARYNATARQLNALIDAYGCIRAALIDRKDASSCLR